VQDAVNAEFDSRLSAGGSTTSGASLVGWDNGNLAQQLMYRIFHVVDSVVELQALDESVYTRAFALGYYAPGDLGGGPYYYVNGSTAAVDGGSVLPTKGGTGRWNLQIVGPVSIRQFGAKGDNTADDRGPTLSWSKFVLTNGIKGFADEGRYRITQEFVMDWALAPKNGASFEGAGRNRAVFDLTTVQTAPAWFMTNTASDGAAFDGAFKGIGIVGNCPGPVFQVGREDYVDAFNEFEFDVGVENHNATTNACAIELNGVYNCDLFLVGNNAGYGTALRLRALQFSDLRGSFGNAERAMHLTAGYVYGNDFISLDLEVVNNCVVIDSAAATRNTWIGGQLVWSNGVGPAGYGVVASAGNTNRFVGTNPASSGNVVDPANAVGIEFDGQGVGAHVSGGVTVVPVTGDGAVAVDSPSTNTSLVEYRRGGKRRWLVGRNTAAEAGSNAGSNLFIGRCDDTGALIDDPVSIDRQTGIVAVTKLAVSQIALFGGGLMTGPVTLTGSRGGSTLLSQIVNLLAEAGLAVDETTA
ncbi:hypothetical protein ACLFKT_37125, partial [Paraburkholderia sp. BR14261]